MKKKHEHKEKDGSGSHSTGVKRKGRGGTRSSEPRAKSVKVEDTDASSEQPTTSKDQKDHCMVPLSRINPHIMCGLCNGYLVDATTVIDCLHTFCKKCLLNYFEEEDNCCPKCGQLIHQSHPSHYVAFDRTMQDIVYKLVPGMLKEERRRRLDFLREEKIKDGIDVDALEKEKKTEQCVGTNRCFEGPVINSHHRADDQIVVELQRGEDDLPVPKQRFIRTSDLATVNTLKRYLAHAMWQTMSRYSELDVFCNGELMGRDFSLRFIQLTRCRNKPKDKPLLLVYRNHVEY